MTAYERRISDWSSDVCSSDLREKPACQRNLRGISSAAIHTAVVPGLVPGTHWRCRGATVYGAHTPPAGPLHARLTEQLERWVPATSAGTTPLGMARVSLACRRSCECCPSGR